MVRSFPKKNLSHYENEKNQCRKLKMYKSTAHKIQNEYLVARWSYISGCFWPSHLNYFSTIQNGHADSHKFRLQSPVPGSSEVVRCGPTVGLSRLLTLRLPGRTTGTITICTITCGAGQSCCHSIVRSQQLTANLCEYLLDGFINRIKITIDGSKRAARDASQSIFHFCAVLGKLAKIVG